MRWLEMYYTPSDAGELALIMEDVLVSACVTNRCHSDPRNKAINCNAIKGKSY